MGATAQGEVLRVHAATPGGFTGRGQAAWGGEAAWAGQQLSRASYRLCSHRSHTPAPTVDEGLTARSQLAAGAALQGLPQGPGHSVHILPRGVAAQQADPQHLGAGQREEVTSGGGLAATTEAGAEPAGIPQCGRRGRGCPWLAGHSRVQRKVSPSCCPGPPWATGLGLGPEHSRPQGPYLPRRGPKAARNLDVVVVHDVLDDVPPVIALRDHHAGDGGQPERLQDARGSASS